MIISSSGPTLSMPLIQGITKGRGFTSVDLFARKPLELVKGIGSNYDAVWSYLDSVYGDPRYIADVVT